MAKNTTRNDAGRERTLDEVIGTLSAALGPFVVPADFELPAELRGEPPRPVPVWLQRRL